MHMVFGSRAFGRSFLDIWIPRAMGATVAAALLLTAGCVPSGPNALLQGEQLIRGGKYQQAIAKLKIATAALPHNAQAWNHLGLAYHSARQYPEALAAYRQALLLDPNLAAARFNLGSLLMEQNNPAAAVPEFTTCTILQPGAAAGWLKLGLAQFQARQAGLGAPALTTALRLQPVNPDAWNVLGLIALEKNKPPEALADFTAALRCQTNYAPALLNRAIVLHRYAKNHPLALQTYREYTRLNPPPPNLSQVQDIIAQLEQEMAPAPSRMIPSLAASNTMAALKPGTNQAMPSPLAPALAGTNTLARTNAGTNAALASNPPRKNIPLVAVSRTNVAANLTLESPASRRNAAPPATVKTNAGASPVPESLPPPANVALPAVPSRPVTNLLADSRKSEEPAKAAPAATVKKEATVPRQETLGTEKPNPAVASTQTVAEAAASSEPSRAQRPAVVRTMPGGYPYRSPAVPSRGDRAKAVQWLKEGVQLQHDGHWNEAVAAYQKASEADPAFFDAHHNLGMAAQAAGLLPQALLEYEIALAIDPASVNARYNFAITLQRANYPRDAALELERLLATRPADCRVHLLLANLYARDLRQKALARSHYRQILELDPQNDQAPAIRAWLAANP